MVEHFVILYRTTSYLLTKCSLNECVRLNVLLVASIGFLVFITQTPNKRNSHHCSFDIFVYFKHELLFFTFCLCVYLDKSELSWANSIIA